MLRRMGTDGESDVFHSNSIRSVRFVFTTANEERGERDISPNRGEGRTALTELFAEDGKAMDDGGRMHPNGPEQVRRRLKDEGAFVTELVLEGTQRRRVSRSERLHSLARQLKGEERCRGREERGVELEWVGCSVGRVGTVRRA